LLGKKKWTQRSGKIPLLANPLDAILCTENVFYLVAAADTPLLAGVEHLKVWLLQQLEEFRFAN
jgi:hypothetical protein